MPQREHIQVRRGVENRSRDREERVEPAPRLVNCFSNEICGEVLLEPLSLSPLLFLALRKRVVPLRERGRARVVPAVNYIFYSPHFSTAPLSCSPLPLALQHHLVNSRSVKVKVAGNRTRRPLSQLRHASNAALRPALLADPNVQRRSPEPLPAQRPVLDALEKIPKPAVLQVCGKPVYLLVVREQPVPQRPHSDEPRLAGVVQERRPAPPAERVGVQIRTLLEQNAPLLKHLNYSPVRVLHKDTLQPQPRRDLAREPSFAVHWLRETEPLLLADLVVVCSERGCDVNDARAFLQTDEIRSDYFVSLALYAYLKERFVLLTFQIRPF